jgi:succinate dehydrogenase / fumarate reductase, iron-sulfur subunit
MKTLNVKVKRYIPERGTYETETHPVPYEKDMSLLMALQYLYEEKDIHFRHSCDVGLCAICLMKVNGKPRLACKEIIERPDEIVVVEPMETFPALRDLVVSMEKKGKE